MVDVYFEHAVVIGGHQFIRFFCQDRECGPLVALVFGLFPDARQHHRLAVSAGEIIRLLATFVPPFVEAFARNDAPAKLQVRAELPFAHSLGADVEERR